MFRARLALLAAIVALLAVAPAYANDSAIGGVGGAVHPISVDGIRMESEAVQLIAFSTYAAVRVDFKFTNSGEARTVKLGFPFELPYEKQDPGDLPPAAGFRAWQDGEPLAVTWTPPVRGDVEPEGGYVGYYVHEATFKPGVTMIRVQYLAQPNSAVPTPDIPAPPDKYKGMMSSNASYEYWVHTGAGWAGTIGKSVIRFTLSPDFQGWGVDEAQKKWASEPGLPPEVAKNALAFTRPDPSTYEWTFVDYEPTLAKHEYTSPYDVSLHYWQPTWSDMEFNQVNLPGWPPDHVVEASASSHLVLDEFEYVPEAAFSGVSWAWAEGVKGSGSGEWVKANFAGERTIEEIRVLPGYAKSPALFAKYNRPKTLIVEFSDGVKQTLTLADEPSLQVFPVKTKATWAKVTIGEVYRGTTRDETYLSLVDFGKSKAPRFLTFEEAMGIAPPATEKPAKTGTGGGGAKPALPFASSWLILAVAVGAGLLGLAAIAGLVVLLMRGRKP